jgi:hypothetical protein
MKIQHLTHNAGMDAWCDNHYCGYELHLGGTLELGHELCPECREIALRIHGVKVALPATISECWPLAYQSAAAPTLFCSGLGQSCQDKQ